MHSAQGDVLQKMRQGLHDLAQPLTALQCRLWLGTMDGPTAPDVHATLQDSLRECDRMIAGLRAMQEHLECAMNLECALNKGVN